MLGMKCSRRLPSLKEGGELPRGGALPRARRAWFLNATPQPQRSALAELRDGDDGAERAIGRTIIPCRCPARNGGAPRRPSRSPEPGPSRGGGGALAPEMGGRPAPQKPSAKQPEDSENEVGAIHHRQRRHASLRARAAPRRPRDLAASWRKEVISCKAEPSFFVPSSGGPTTAPRCGEPSGKSAKPTAAMIARARACCSASTRQGAARATPRRRAGKCHPFRRSLTAESVKARRRRRRAARRHTAPTLHRRDPRRRSRRERRVRICPSRALCRRRGLDTSPGSKGERAPRRRSASGRPTHEAARRRAPRSARLRRARATGSASGRAGRASQQACRRVPSVGASWASRPPSRGAWRWLPKGEFDPGRRRRRRLVVVGAVSLWWCLWWTAADSSATGASCWRASRASAPGAAPRRGGGRCGLVRASVGALVRQVRGAAAVRDWWPAAASAAGAGAASAAAAPSEAVAGAGPVVAGASVGAASTAARRLVDGLGFWRARPALQLSGAHAGALRRRAAAWSLSGGGDLGVFGVRGRGPQTGGGVCPTWTSSSSASGPWSSATPSKRGAAGGRRRRRLDLDRRHGLLRRGRRRGERRLELQGPERPGRQISPPRRQGPLLARSAAKSSVSSSILVGAASIESRAWRGCVSRRRPRAWRDGPRRAQRRRDAGAGAAGAGAGALSGPGAAGAGATPAAPAMRRGRRALGALGDFLGEARTAPRSLPHMDFFFFRLAGAGAFAAGTAGAGALLRPWRVPARAVPARGPLLLLRAPAPSLPRGRGRRLFRCRWLGGWRRRCSFRRGRLFRCWRLDGRLGLLRRRGRLRGLCEAVPARGPPERNPLPPQARGPALQPPVVPLPTLGLPRRTPLRRLEPPRRPAAPRRRAARAPRRRRPA